MATSSEPEALYTLAVVGAGPGGTSVILRAARTNLLDALLAKPVAPSRAGGVLVVHQGDETTLASGKLGQYQINSNTYADKFVKNFSDDKSDSNPPEVATGTFLEAVGATARATRLRELGHATASLSEVGAYLADAGDALRTALRDAPASACALKTTCVSVTLCDDGEIGPGGVFIPYKRLALEERANDAAAPRTYTARALHVVMATGGAPKPLKHPPALAALAGAPTSSLGRAWDDKTVLADDFLRGVDGGKLAARLTECAAARAAAGTNAAAGPRVVVVGGSHSAMSAVWHCLHHYGSGADGDAAAGFKWSWGTNAVAVVHRSAIRVHYYTKREAEIDGYAFDGPAASPTRGGGALKSMLPSPGGGSGDPPPKAKQINAFGGLRADAKALFNSVRRGTETRVKLYLCRPGQNLSLIARLYDDADVIVSATGYETALLPFYEADGETRIEVKKIHGQVEVMETGHIRRAVMPEALPRATEAPDATPPSPEAAPPAAAAPSAKDAGLADADSPKPAPAKANADAGADTDSPKPAAPVADDTCTDTDTDTDTDTGAAPPPPADAAAALPPPLATPAPSSARDALTTTFTRDCLPGLYGVGLGWGLPTNSTNADGTPDGSNGRADGVAVYIKHAAALVLGGIFGPDKAYGEGNATWEARQVAAVEAAAKQPKPTPMAVERKQKDSISRLLQPLNRPKASPGKAKAGSAGAPPPPLPPPLVLATTGPASSASTHAATPPPAAKQAVPKQTPTKAATGTPKPPKPVSGKPPVSSPAARKAPAKKVAKPTAIVTPSLTTSVLNTGKRGRLAATPKPSAVKKTQPAAPPKPEALTQNADEAPRASATPPLVDEVVAEECGNDCVLGDASTADDAAEPTTADPGEATAPAAPTVAAAAAAAPVPEPAPVEVFEPPVVATRHILEKAEPAPTTNSAPAPKANKLGRKTSLRGAAVAAITAVAAGRAARREKPKQKPKPKKRKPAKKPAEAAAVASCKAPPVAAGPPPGSPVGSPQKPYDAAVYAAEGTMPSISPVKPGRAQGALAPPPPAVTPSPPKDASPPDRARSAAQQARQAAAAAARLAARPSARHSHERQVLAADALIDVVEADAAVAAADAAAATTASAAAASPSSPVVSRAAVAKASAAAVISAAAAAAAAMAARTAASGGKRVPAQRSAAAAVAAVALSSGGRQALPMNPSSLSAFLPTGLAGTGATAAMGARRRPKTSPRSSNHGGPGLDQRPSALTMSDMLTRRSMKTRVRSSHERTGVRSSAGPRSAPLQLRSLAVPRHTPSGVPFSPVRNVCWGAGDKATKARTAYAPPRRGGDPLRKGGQINTAGAIRLSATQPVTLRATSSQRPHWGSGSGSAGGRGRAIDW